jgi:hypothetical protein
MRIKSALLAVGVAAAGLVGFAGSAQAAGACPADTACLWSGADFTGTRFVFPTDGRWPSFVVRSVRNADPGSPAALYYNANYRGPCFTVRAGGAVSDTRNVRMTDGGTGDRTRSIRFDQVCGTVYAF